MHPPQATDLVYSTQPANVEAGDGIVAVVTAVDPAGQIAASWAEPITLSLALNPGGSSLGGTLEVLPTDGRAVFDNVILLDAAEGYRLRATSGSLVPATSVDFDVLAGPVAWVHVNPSALSLTFPSGSLSAQLSLVQEDAFGNPTSLPVVWTVDDPTKATVTQGGHVTGNTGLTVVRAEAGTGELEVPVVTTCVPGRCSHRLQVSGPGGAAVGEVLSPSLEVETGGAGSVGFPAWVNVHLGQNAAGATLSGTLRMRTSALNRAVFDDLRVDRAGTYTIVTWVEGDDGGVYGMETASFMVVEPQ